MQFSNSSCFSLRARFCRLSVAVLTALAATGASAEVTSQIISNDTNLNAATEWAGTTVKSGVTLNGGGYNLTLTSDALFEDGSKIENIDTLTMTSAGSGLLNNGTLSVQHLISNNSVTNKGTITVDTAKIKNFLSGKGSTFNAKVLTFNNGEGSGDENAIWGTFNVETLNVGRAGAFKATLNAETVNISYLYNNNENNPDISFRIDNGGGDNWNVGTLNIDTGSGAMSDGSGTGFIQFVNGEYKTDTVNITAASDSRYSGIQNYFSTVEITTLNIAEEARGMLNAYDSTEDKQALFVIGTANVASNAELYLNSTDPTDKPGKTGEYSKVTIDVANFAQGSSVTEKDSKLDVGSTLEIKTLNAKGMTIDPLRSNTAIQIGTANMLEGNNTFNQSVTGMKDAGGNSALTIVVNEGAKASFSALTANDLNVTLNTLAENSLQSAQTHADNVVVTVNSELNAGETSAVIAAAQAAVSLGQVDPVATASEGTYKVIIEEGVINPGVTINYADPNDPSSAQTVVVTPNRKIAAYSGMVAATTMAWIGQMNDLYKRMGNLRDSAGDTGLWSRVYQYKNKYQSGDIKSKNTTLQIGADHRLGDWIVGGAFSYTDGNMNYSGGSGDMKNYGFAAYGSWLGPNGLFADVIGKYTRMETKFNADGMNGKVHNNAVNLSAEAGWKVDLTEQFFVEPQAELSLGRVNGKDIKAGNGVSVHQDNFSAVVGRVGLRSGFNLPQNKGQVYARASILHNWDSKVTGTATAAGSTAKIREDLSGTYYEMGLGAQFNFNKNAYMYADVERQAGGAVKEPWRWNVGVRYSF